MTMSFKSPDPELVAQLEQNRRYSETVGREGKKANLALEDHTDLDLRGAVLQGAMLQEANLSGCCLDEADFYYSIANGIRLERAQIARADFTKAALEGADFRGAYGPEARFIKAELRGARFDGGRFPNASFRRVRGWEVSFRDTFLEGVDFTNSYLNDTDFTGAALANANFSGAMVSTKTLFSNAQGLDRVTVERIHIEDGPACEHFEGSAAREAFLKLAKR